MDTGKNAIVISGPLEDDFSYAFLREQTVLVSGSKYAVQNDSVRCRKAWDSRILLFHSSRILNFLHIKNKDHVSCLRSVLRSRALIEQDLGIYFQSSGLYKKKSLESFQFLTIYESSKEESIEEELGIFPSPRT